MHKKIPLEIPRRLLSIRRVAAVEFSPVFQDRDKSSASIMVVASATLEMGFNRR